MEHPKNKELKYGEVQEALPSLQFKVKLDDGSEILAYLAGRLIVHRIRILAGDRVTVETSPYDQTRGRIVYRGIAKRQNPDPPR